MANDTILETRGLTKEFKGFVAVNGVDLSVKRGTIHALIGPNGAGKTTCFNLLTHFLIPTRGQIFFNSQEITGSRPSTIARMGLVRSFQISAVFPHLTVLENVRIALQRKRGHSYDFWRAERALAALAPIDEETDRQTFQVVMTLIDRTDTVLSAIPAGKGRNKYNPNRTPQEIISAGRNKWMLIFP